MYLRKTWHQSWKESSYLQLTKPQMYRVLKLTLSLTSCLTFPSNAFPSLLCLTFILPCRLRLYTCPTSTVTSLGITDFWALILWAYTILTAFETYLEFLFCQLGFLFFFLLCMGDSKVWPGPALLRGPLPQQDCKLEDSILFILFYPCDLHLVCSE